MGLSQAGKMRWGVGCRHGDVLDCKRSKKQAGSGEGTMDREQLRATQSPLKERYRSDPASAVVTLRAAGRLGEDVSCNVETGRALVTAGLHRATGGTGLAACSGDISAPACR